MVEVVLLEFKPACVPGLNGFALHLAGVVTQPLHLLQFDALLFQLVVGGCLDACRELVGHGLFHFCLLLLLVLGVKLGTLLPVFLKHKHRHISTVHLVLDGLVDAVDFCLLLHVQLLLF